MSNRPIFTLLGILIIGSIDLAFINAVNNVITLQESGAFGVKISKLEYEVYYHMTLIFGNHAKWAAYSTAILFLFSIGAYLNQNYDTLKKVSLIIAIALYIVCSYTYINHPIDIPEKNILGKFVYQNIYEFAGQSTAFIAWCVLTLTLFIFSLILLGYDVGSKADYLLSMIGYGFDSTKKKISNSFMSISKKELLGKGVTHTDHGVTHTDHGQMISKKVYSNNKPSLEPIIRPTTQVMKKDIMPVPVKGKKEVDTTIGIPILTDQIKEKDGKTGNNGEALTGELITRNMETLGINGINPIGLRHGPMITSYEFKMKRLQPSDLARIKSKDVLDSLAVNLGFNPDAMNFRIDERGIFHYDFLRKEEDRRVGHFIKFLKDIRDPKKLDIEHNTKFPIPLGYGIDGKIVVVCMYTMKHILCTGISGCGKSNFIHILMICQMKHAIENKKNIEYYFIDIKGAASTFWKEFKAVKGIASTHIDAFKLLNMLGEKIEERNKIINELQVQDILDANEKLEKKGMPTYPIIILVIDEIALLVDKDRKDVNKEILSTINAQLGEIVKAGRKHGVYLMAFGTRIMREKDLSSSTVTELTKIVFNTGGSIEARTSSGRTNVPANKLALVGDAFFVGQRVIRFHTPSLGKKEDIEGNLHKWIEQLNSAL